MAEKGACEETGSTAVIGRTQTAAARGATARLPGRLRSPWFRVPWTAEAPGTDAAALGPLGSVLWRYRCTCCVTRWFQFWVLTRKRRLCPHRNLHMLTLLQLKLPKTWKQPKCPPAGDWMSVQGPSAPGLLPGDRAWAAGAGCQGQTPESRVASVRVTESVWYCNKERHRTGWKAQDRTY